MFKKLFKYGSGPTYVMKEYGRRYNVYSRLLYIFVGISIITILIAAYEMMIKGNYLFWIIVNIIAFISTRLAYLFRKKFDDNEKTYGVGYDAEELIGTKLAAMGDNYKVIHDILKGKKMGNIDHVVIGPTGIFAIETKGNTKDNIFYYQNGIKKFTKFGNKFVNQAASNALWVHNVLKDKLDIDKWVYGVVVRPLKENAKIKGCRDNKVSVLDGDEVIDYIKNFDNILSNNEIGNIHSLLLRIKKLNN